MNKDQLIRLFTGITDEFPSDLTSKSQKAKVFRNEKKRKQNKAKDVEKYMWETRVENIKQTNTKPKKEQKYEINQKSGSRIKMTRAEMRKGIIYSEILGKPKSIR